MQMPEGMERFPGMGQNGQPNAGQNNAQNIDRPIGQNNGQNNSQNGGQMRPSGNGNQKNGVVSNRPQMQMPEGMGGFPGMGPNQQTQPTNQAADYISLAICLVVLLLACVFVKFYKRKNY